MGIEIEKKFLLANDGWRDSAEGTHYRQGYINSMSETTVRVRTAGDKGYLTIKGPTVNAGRLEYEYEIPLEEAREMLERLANRRVEKRRYLIDYQGFTWEIDEFLGSNSGLVVAEIELESADQQFPLPPWIGQEVTDDPRYYNSNLAARPYCDW